MDINKEIMKLKIYKISFSQCLLMTFSALMFFSACQKDEFVASGPDRLFRPALKGDLVSNGNWIDVNFEKVKGATSYILQVSRDTFKTIDRTVTLDSSHVRLNNLKWDQLYQLQMRAVASDTAKNSKISLLGAIKTPKFPSIMVAPTINDVTDVDIKVSWVNSGSPVTSIKILKTDSTLVREVSITATDITNRNKIISGLSSSTQYIVLLYSGTTLRGYENYTTKSPISGILIDLRSIDLALRPNILADTLPKVPNGSTVILKKGTIYNVSAAINISKSMKLIGGPDINITSNPIINITSTNAFLGIVAGSNIDYIDFEGLTLRGTSFASSSGGYVFNINTNCSIGRISFESCESRIWRGFMRFQTATINITNIIINKTLIDQVGGYGIVTVDAATCKVDNITLSNSTVANVEKVIVSKSNAVNVTITDNTFYQAPLAGNYLIDYNNVNVTGLVKINNNIFSIGKANTATPPSTAVNGKRGTMTIDASNNFSTSDYTVLTASTAIPGVTALTKTSLELFTDPANGDFKIKDLLFTGKSSAGDPRWRL